VLPVSDLAVGMSAPDLELLDAEERTVALSSLWKRAPLALIFLRHFG
jgi:peroxiredoxin